MVDLTIKDRFAAMLGEENAKSETPDFAPSPEISEVAPPQFGPPAPNPMQQRFQKFLDEQETETDQSTAIALDAARIQNPKLYQKAKETAGLNDLPPDVVYRNIEMFDQREKLDRARAVLRTNPTLNDWFSHADNAKTVEVENLENANNVAWMLKAGTRAVTQGVDQIDVADIRYKQMFGLASKEDIARADQLESMFQEDFGGAGWLGKAYTGALSQLPIMGTVAADALKGATIGAGIGAGVGSAIPGLGTMAGMGTGATALGSVAAFRRSMQVNSGLAFSEFSKFRTSDGKLIDQNTAAGAALISGSLAAGLDTASFGVLLKATGLGSLFTKLGAKQGIKEALKDKTFRQVAAAVGKRYAGAIGAETVTESIQEGIQIALGEVAKIADAEVGGSVLGTLNTPLNEAYGGYKPITPVEAISRMAEAGRDALLATAFLGVVPMGGRLAMDYSAAKQHVDETAKIERLIDMAGKDPLVKDNPAKAAEVIAEAVQGTDKDTVYIDTDTIKQFMQDEDSAELAALARVPEFQKRLQEAVQTGGDVAISTADFYAYVAPSDGVKGIVDRLKFSPEGMSRKEAEAFVKALEKVKEAGIPEAAPESSVSLDIFEKVRKAGGTPDQARQYAALYGAFFDSMASQTGRSAYDIYKAYSLDIQQVDANPTADALNTFKQLGAFDTLPSQPRSDKEVKVFHGTDVPAFNKFQREHSGWTAGAFFFTNNPEYSSQFASKEGQMISDEEMASIEPDVDLGSPHNIPAYINAEGFKEVDMTGHFFHDRMPDGRASRDWLEEQVIVAKSEGFKGLVIKGMEDSYDTDFEPVVHDTYITWTKGTVRSALSENTLFQNQGGGRTLRGSITFMPDKTTIRLFKNANLSTLLHESGHLFLQVMADLVNGKRAYGDQLFNQEELDNGSWVLLYDENGEQLTSSPVKVNSYRRVLQPDGDTKVEITVEGGKGIYDGSRAVVVSAPTAPKADLKKEAEDILKAQQESEVPALPMGESPVEDPAALGTASSPEEISPEDSSYYGGKFDIIVGSNSGFKKFVEGKPQETPLQKRDLLFAYFPRSKEAMAHAQSKAHREQNRDPALQAKLAEAGMPVTPSGKKANPLGVQTEDMALLDIDGTVEYVGSVIQATAKLNAAISGRQSEKIFKALRFSMRKLRKGAEEGAINAEAWTELEAELQLIQQNGTFPDKVKDIVNEYIRLYKKDEATRAAKEEGKNKREGEQAAREVETARKEDLAAAITELSTVVERVEKIEQQKIARQSLIDDMAILQDWLGEKGPLFSTAAHEKFAVGFEAYLFEGVAPSEGLRRVFDRFRTWLKLVYRKITNLGVQPTPEVKAVFGRMLTVDQAIANAISSPAFQPSFSSPEEMGVSQQEFDEYMALVNSLAEVGRKAADKVVAGEASKLRTKAVQDKKKQLRAEAHDDLMGQRVYRVINYLQGNKLGGVKGLDPVKLDRARVIQIVGKNKLNTIPNGPSMWTKEGGAEPNMVATMFGYNSGAEMLAEIASVEPLKVAVEARVDKLIAEMTDEQLVTPEEVAQMAEAKLRSGVYQDFLRQEIRTFSKLMGIDFTEAHVTQFKRMADDIIGEKRVRTVARRNFIREYTEADRKIGRLLDTAIKKKDFASILDLRRKQLFNSFLIQKAYEAKKNSDEAVKYLKSFTKKKSNVVDQEYLTQIRNMVIGFNFIKGQIDPAAKPFSVFLDAELDSGQMIIVDPRLKKQDTRAYLHLTHDELMALRDAIKNLDYVGRTKRKIFKEGKVLDLKLATTQIVEAMEANLRPVKESDTLNRRGFAKLSAHIQTYLSGHIKIEQLCDWIDGRAAQGPAHKYIFQPMVEAQAREVELTSQYAQKVLEIVRRKPSDYWSDEILISEINKRVRRSEMLAVALNMGNESNLKKLKKGMGWTDTQLAAITENLDADDWAIAQAIWDTIDGLWPMVLEVAARTGIPRPDKVEPVSFTNKHGTFRGGYYPVVYDPSKSADALARGLTTRAEAQFGFQPQSIFPAKSFANDRDNEYARPIFLDMTVLPQHISKVVHYVTHAEAAYNVQKIMSQTEFKDRLLAQFGQGMFENMKGWIENITKGETEVSGLGAANRFMRHLRQNVSLAALGFRLTTVVAQAGGVFAGAEMIGMSGVARGFKEMYGSASIERIQANFDFVRSRSPEMRHRTQFLDRDLTYIGSAFEERGYMQVVKDAAMKPMMVADNIVATAVWMGAYTRQMSRDPHDEATAIAYADKTVRLTQGAAGAKDLSAMQRGSEFFKLFTVFYTYFAALQNRLVDVVRTASYRRGDAPEIQRMDTPNEVVRYIYLIVLPSLTFDFMMKGAMQGDFSDDSESEKNLLGTALWKIVSYSLAGFIGIRDMASFVGKDGFEWRYGGPPMLRTIGMMIERTSRALLASVDENRDVKPSDVVRTGIDAVGITTGLPLDAPSLILQNYLKAQEKGEDIGPADFFVRR